MIIGLAIVFSAFLFFAVASGRSVVTNRTRREWLIDSGSLLVQGLIIPVAQTLLIERVWSAVMPSLRGSLHVSPWIAFGLSFVVVDYLYYWNHRFLHLPFMWRWHQLHHSTGTLDFIASSRNSLLTPAFIIYVWANSLFIFALGDATPFIIASSLGAALDLWRHSGFVLATNSLGYRLLNRWLILPQHHEQHHSPVTEGINFGANFSLWDKLHGTYLAPSLSRESQPAANIRWQTFVWPSKDQAS